MCTPLASDRVVYRPDWAGLRRFCGSGGYSRAGTRFGFRLKASNGEVIASSKSYKTKASDLNGVESVKKNAGSAVVDLTEET